MNSTPPRAPQAATLCTCTSEELECNDAQCSYGQHDQIQRHRWLHTGQDCPHAQSN